MDGATSFIGVVGFALASTKVVYQTVTGVRDAPEIAAQTSSRLQAMSNILEELKLHNQPLSPSVLNIVQQYYGEIKKYSDNLERRQLLPTDNIVRRILKRTKIHLQVDDLDRIRQLTHHRLAELQAHLSIIERYVCLEFLGCFSNIVAQFRTLAHPPPASSCWEGI